MAQVTVVITTLNRVGFLAEAIESALAQTFDQIEVLVSDDGGFEATRNLCRKFQDARLRHIVNPARLGIAMNTYSGVMAAKSDLIAFLNDDDRWTPDFLEKCARPLIEDNEAALAFSDHWLINEAGERLIAQTDENTRRYRRDVLSPGYVSDPVKLIASNSIPLAMASVFRKTFVDWSLYTEAIAGSYDYFLSYTLLRSGGKVLYIPDRLTEYRLHDGSATAKFQLVNTLGTIYVNDLILGDQRFASIAKDMRRNRVGLQNNLVKLYVRQRELMPAAKHLAKSMKYRMM